jgi:hypothetical protein
LAESISVEAVTPPLVGMAILKSKQQTLQAALKEPLPI